MNRYRITALEDIEVAVSRERPATVIVRGIPRRVMTREPQRWMHLAKGEACEVYAVHAIRGDLLEEVQVRIPDEACAPVVIHEALKVEALPVPETGQGCVFSQPQ